MFIKKISQDPQNHLHNKTLFIGVLYVTTFNSDKGTSNTFLPNYTIITFHKKR